MRNWKTFISSLDGMTNLQIIDACRAAGLEQVSKEAKYQSRIVFALNNKWVLKVSVSMVGMMQTNNELMMADYLDSVPNHKRHFAKVHSYSYDSGGRFIIMQRLNTSAPALKLCKQVAKNAWSHRADDDRTGLVKVVLKLDQYLGLQNINDLRSDGLRNYGVDDKGRVRVLDFGASMRVYGVYAKAIKARRENPRTRQELKAEQDVLASEF